MGDDQKQHLEITRDIAQRFNNDFSSEGEEFFPSRAVNFTVASRVMSLRDGQKKMSKSDPSDMSRIDLIDDADLIRKKIGKAKTDPLPLPDSRDEGLETRPEALNFNEHLLLESRGKAWSRPWQSMRIWAVFSDFKSRMLRPFDL